MPTLDEIVNERLDEGGGPVHIDTSKVPEPSEFEEVKEDSGLSVTDLGDGLLEITKSDSD